MRTKTITEKQNIIGLTKCIRLNERNLIVNRLVEERNLLTESRRDDIIELNRMISVLEVEITAILKENDLDNIVHSHSACGDIIPTELAIFDRKTKEIELKIWSE